VKRWLQRKWLRRAALILFAVAVLAAMRAWQQRDLIAGPAPELSGKAVSGQHFTLANVSRPTLVYFWASWCPVCGLTRHTVESLATDHAVVTVALASGTEQELAQYMKQHGVSAPTLNDPDGAYAAQWGVRGTPTFFVLDRKGVIRFREVGYASEIGLRVRLWLAQ
jgi:thiol-disulfide isomerase/thioredoxin